MAVEIPVVVDIEGAFNDAARRVSSAMRPLTQKIEDQGVLELKFRMTVPTAELSKFGNSFKKISEDAKQGTTLIERSFEQLWEKGKPRLEELKIALASFKTQLNSKWNSGDIDSSQVASLQKAIILMEEYVNNRNRAVSLTEEQYRKSLQAARAEEQRRFIIQQEANTISEINAKLGALRGSLNNLSLEGKDAEWERIGEEIQKATASLAKFEEKYNRVTTKPGSINRMNSEMQALTAKWNQMSAAAKFDKNGNLTAAAQRVIEKFKKLTEEARKFGISLEEAANVGARGLDKTNSKLVSLIKNSLRLIAIHAAGRFVRNIREVTSEFELQRVALGSIIRDTERAEYLFRQIKAAAIESPFEIKDLVSYTKQLSAYQIETDKLFETTKKLADVSAGLGVDMGRLILAYGQVRAASVLRGQELRQFTEAGIPLVDELAKKFTKLRGEMVTTGEVFELISDRAVPFSMIAEIFDDMTSAGGMFYKMQEKQAKTLAGQWANLKDAASIMYDEIGNTSSVHGAMETMIRDARWLLQNWRALSDVIKIAGGAILTYIGLTKLASAQTKILANAEKILVATESQREAQLRRLITSLIGETAAEKVATAGKTAHTWATRKLTAANSALAKSIWSITVAMLNNPFGIAAVAVGGLIALFTTLRNRTRDVNKDLDAANASINSLNNTRSVTAKLIDDYEQLARKQNLTTEESKKLRDISQELARIFPAASEGIDKNTNSLSLNILKLRQYNEEAEKATVKGMQAQIRLDKKEIERNGREIERLSNDILRGWGANRYNRNARLFSPVLMPFTDEQLAEMNERIAELTKTNERYSQSIKEMEDAINGIESGAGGATQSLKSWQTKLIEFNGRVSEDGYNIRVMTDDQIKGFSKLDKALEEVAQQYAAEAKQVKILEAALEGKNEEEAKDIQLALSRAIARKELTQEILEYYHAMFLTAKKSGGSSQTDPFVTAMKDRIKFMKDFRRGYDELRKYMTSDAALHNEGLIMSGRGLSLGISQKEQYEAAEQLTGWYRKMITIVADKLKAKGVTGASVTDILAIDTTKRSKYVRDLQALLQELWDNLTDLRVNEAKKKIEDALKRLENEIKRSETARNFFQDIFDLTGDEQLAANMAVSVYGEPGKELADRIRESIQGAMSAEGIKSDSATWGKLLGAAQKMDFRAVMADISSLPDGVQKAVQEAASAIEKQNSEIAKSYAKLLMSYNDIEQERVNINTQAAAKIRAIESGLQLELRAIAEKGGDESMASSARVRAAEAMIAVEREQRAELYKLSDDYRLFFNTVNILSVESARKIAAKQKKILADRLANEEISFARYKRELKEVEEQLSKYENRRSPFLTYLKDGLDAVIEQFKQTADDLQGLAASVGKSSIGEGGVFTPDAAARAFLEKCDQVLNRGLFSKILKRKNSITIEQRITAASTKAYNEAFNNAIMRGKSDDVAKAFATSQAAAAASAEASGAAAEAAGAAASAAAGAAWAEFWIRNIYSLLTNIDERVTKGGKKAAPKWLDYLASGVTWTWGKVGEGAWDKLADVNSHAIKWLEEIKSGDLVGSFFTLGDAIYDIFRGKSIREANREIQEQSDIITDLERSYSRLDVAIKNAFGSDYIYNFNRQLELLEIEAEAYRKQAESERSKGKDADEDVAKGYERSAEDVENKIKDMRSQLQEFFAGTDVASAAKDFAEAWIEAYKEFGSTTDAISQKFNDMIENMVVNSLSAQLIQSILQPVFDAIDEASKDGALSADDIGAISAMIPGRVSMINDAMNTLMNQLLSTGIDLQRQAGQFTGISRNIAGASEESILSLAAGINTQNYYMSHIDVNVAAILTALTGEEASGQNRARSAASPDAYKEQMLEYVSAIPLMRDDMASVRAMLERVIRPIGTPASHYVSARV